MKKKTHKEYVEEIARINPNIEVIGIYSGAHEKIKHKCLIDGYEWDVTPHNILKGRGCPMCTGHIQRTQEEYVKEVFLINPNIEVLGVYINNMFPISHKCLLHNVIWDAIPVNILRGHGCRQCGNEILANMKRKDKGQYIEDLKRINSNIILIGEYINAHIPTKHKCLIDNHEWNAKPNNILSGTGCPVCNESFGERQIRQWLDKNNIMYESQKVFKNCCNINTLPFDFYLPDYNVVIEYQGEQHYKPIDYFGGEKNFKMQQKRDNIKREYCKNNNIRLLEIPYYDSVEEKLNNFLFI